MNCETVIGHMLSYGDLNIVYQVRACVSMNQS